ncbi:hypothetical protein QNI19_32725 [Cytophagaceae bacterium DM2B3-1]|uniref:Uncharacterized protein n=1 Tax=Xanthocytophaga flava TaxID=3048013 RepID=A0ABT7CW70_9BACT|nr:hypothetical protein [Xanthocytophaga flavus]MDJ1497751.1 hypothetical protein [Xanthocytophaga flavus]
MKQKIIKIIAITVGTGIVLFFIGIFIMFGLIIGLFEPSYDKEDLIDNYELKHREIQAVKEYVKTQLPANTSVHIEFEDDELSNFTVEQNGKYFTNWELDSNSLHVDSLLTLVGWTQQTVQTIKTKLEEANCISIESGEPATIGFQRSGRGMYLYNLFDAPLTDSLKTVYSNSCRFSFYKDNVVLEYGAGIGGQDCMDGYKRKSR